MRTLVISDVHGNLAALEAVLAEPHDSLICLGDLVGYGPDPAACVRRIRAEDGVIVQGNHDRAIADGVEPRCRADFRRLAEAVVPLTQSQLDSADIRFLRELPHWAAPQLDQSGSALCVHATPRDPLYRYIGPNPSEWESELEGIEAKLVLVGHTHLQFSLGVGSRRVVNPGSVGQPKDGDPRAAYAILENEQIALKRIAYPIEITVRHLSHAGVPAFAVTALTQLLRTGKAPTTRLVGSGRHERSALQ
ncbi:MAG TPA: metallophosphoesterase family protein [Gemmatimonadales bacterium]|nr:metallophosphoesterase family protein [Gemmatimonadales bacterium]